MADREKVVYELNYQVADADWCENEWQDNVPVWMLRGALELLKEQKPRVLTLEEFVAMGDPLDGESICYEIRRGNGSTELQAMLVKCFSDCTKLYGDAFRVWTFRPTDEQRKAVKWE